MTLPTESAPDGPFADLLFERREAAAWITLNRPGALNSLSPSLIAELNRALDAIEHDPSLRCLVLTGAGRAFCAGGDLKTIAALTATGDSGTATSAYFASISGLVARIERLPLPVIAAVNGMAFAGGLEIALGCDLVVASEEATFADAHARYGLLPGGGGSVRLPRRIGASRAKYMMFTANTFPAATMKEWGLVVEVVPAADLTSVVGTLTATLAERSPLGLARMKRMVDDGLEAPTEVGLRAELTICALHDTSHDRREGVTAFIERRSPRFLGR